MEAFWLEATPWDPENEIAVTARLCNTDLSPIVLFGGGEEWLPLIDGGPVFGTTVFNGSFTGRADSTRGEIGVIAGAGEIDAWAALLWQARPCKIWQATIDTTNPGAPVFPTSRELIFDGVVESFDPDAATLALTTLKPAGRVADAQYQGGGADDGAFELIGTRKPFALGVHKNRTALLLDPALLLFQVHGYGAIEELTTVRESGFVLDQARVTQASVAALVAATVAETEIHVHLGSGMFRLGFQPVGDITADFKGGKYAAEPFTAKIGGMARHMLLHSGWPSDKIDASYVTLDTKYPYDAQFYDDGATDVTDALTGLLAPLGCYWDVDQLGNVYFGVLEKQSAEDFSIGDEGLGDFDILEIDHLAARTPFWKTRIGYQFNPNVFKYNETTQYGVVDGPGAITINANAQGTVTDTLPKEFLYKLLIAGQPVSAGNVWSYKVLEGSINAKTPADPAQSMSGTGNGTFTLNSVENDRNTIRIDVAGPVAGSATVSINKQRAAPPIVVAGGSGGGGGEGGGTANAGSSQTGSYANINSTSFTVISDELHCVTGSAATVIHVAVGLEAAPTTTGGAGSWQVQLKVQRLISGVWTDQGSVISGTSVVEVEPGTPTMVTRADLSAAFDVSSLSAATDYTFRLVARLVSGTRLHGFYGNWSVT